MMRTLSMALFSLLVAACQAGPQEPYQSFYGMAQPAPMAQPPAPARVYNIRINGRALTDSDRQTIARLEQSWGRAAVDGDYWYDNATGVLGQWNGPGIAMIPA